MRSFVEYLQASRLLNEDLGALKGMTVAQAEEIMKKNRPDDYKQLMERIQRANAGDKSALLKLTETGGSTDSWGFYKMLTERNVSPEEVENNKRAIEEVVIARTKEWESQGWVKGEDDGSFFYMMQRKKAKELWERVLPEELRGSSFEEQQKYIDFHFGGSREKVYFMFGLKDAEALKKAYSVCMDYYEKNLVMFRQAKVPLTAGRTESFIFYMSGQGDKEKSRLQSEISGLLQGTGVELFSETGTDLAATGNVDNGPSGNHFKSNQIVLEVVLSKLNADTLKGLLDTSLSSKRLIMNRGNSRFFSMWTITHTPALRAIFEKAGIDLKPYTDAAAEDFKKVHGIHTDPRGSGGAGRSGGSGGGVWSYIFAQHRARARV
jgi:hypothetical protein